jgi:hypothetical protein
MSNQECEHLCPHRIGLPATATHAGDTREDPRDFLFIIRGHDRVTEEAPASGENGRRRLGSFV